LGERGKELSQKVEAKRHILHSRSSLDVLKDLNPRFKYMESTGIKTSTNVATTFGVLPVKKRRSINPCSTVSILMNDMRRGSARKNEIKNEMFEKPMAVHNRPRFARNMSIFP